MKVCASATAAPARRRGRLGRVATAWALAGLALTATATAQSARLLYNIDTANAWSDPWPRLAVGDLLLFTAIAAPYGKEVFVTDGTAAGTQLLADINPGAAWSYPDDFVELDGIVFFIAEDPAHGRELWRSDGTPAGTFRLTDLTPGEPETGRVLGVHAFPGLGFALFLAIGSDPSVPRLWRSDGTAAGTFQLKNVEVRGSLVRLGGRVYFRGDNGVSGAEPWVTDGTSAGTTLLKNINPTGPSTPTFLWDEVGGQLFFTAWDATRGEELWRTDGTAAGTRLVRDIYPGPSGSSVGRGLGEIGGRLVFAARHPDTGKELWVSDGTESGTYLLKDIRSGDLSSCCLDPMVPAAGQLFFRVEFDGDVFGSELWKTDGTPAGTTIVRDIVPGPDGSYPDELTPYAGHLTFKAQDASGIHGLWRSDGTPAGTVPIWPATHGALSSIQGVVSDRLIFGGWDSADGTELWGSDGTAAGTAQIEDINQGTESSFPNLLLSAGDVGYFSAQDGIHGSELWQTDGTEAGTGLVTDLNQGDQGSYPRFFHRSGDLAFFLADDDLWRTDGTLAGTIPVLEGVEFLDQTAVIGERLFFVRPDGAGGATLWSVAGSGAPVPVRHFPSGPDGPLRRVDQLTPLGDRLVFLVDWYELWRTDGTEAGTVRLATVLPPASSRPLPALPEPPPRLGIVPFGERAVVVANGVGRSESDLWLTDGTRGGTRRFATLPGRACSSSLCSAALGGRLYFQFDDTYGSGAYGEELWKTNGTAAGTGLAVDLVPGPASSSPGVVRRVGGRLFLLASTADTGRELWISDGTPAGTRLVEDIYPGPTRSAIGELTELDGALVFTARHPDFGDELWRSDGTAEGTELVKDVWSGPDGNSSIDGLVNVGGLVLFQADDGVAGEELWRTDGTEEGTFLLQELEPGPFDSHPLEFTPVGGDKVVFAATVEPMGREPWVLDDWQVTHALEVEVLGGGGGRVVTAPPGIDCLAFCSAIFDHGRTVTLQPIPGSGSQFAGWSGHPDCADGRVRMGGPRGCQATFEPCAAAAVVRVEAVTITDARVYEACRSVVVGPGVVVEGGGSLVLRAPEGIDFHAVVEVGPGGQLTAEIGSL